MRLWQINWRGENYICDVVDKELQHGGASVDYFNPYIEKYSFKEKSAYSINGISSDILKKYDVIAMTAAHTCVYHELIARAGISVFDTKTQ